jgi:hypothetical protein
MDKATADILADAMVEFKAVVTPGGGIATRPRNRASLHPTGRAVDLQIVGGDDKAHQALTRYLEIRGLKPLLERPGGPGASPTNRGTVVHVSWSETGALAAPAPVPAARPAAASAPQQNVQAGLTKMFPWVPAALQAGAKPQPAPVRQEKPNWQETARSYLSGQGPLEVGIGNILRQRGGPIGRGVATLGGGLSDLLRGVQTSAAGQGQAPASIPGRIGTAVGPMAMFMTQPGVTPAWMGTAEQGAEAVLKLGGQRILNRVGHRYGVPVLQILSQSFPGAITNVADSLEAGVRDPWQIIKSAGIGGASAVVLTGFAHALGAAIGAGARVPAARVRAFSAEEQAALGRVKGEQPAQAAEAPTKPAIPLPVAPVEPVGGKVAPRAGKAAKVAPVAPEAPKGGAKEDWQMARAEFLAQPQIARMIQQEPKTRDAYLWAHEVAVNGAISVGKKIPQSVLADYPKMAADYASRLRPTRKSPQTPKAGVAEKPAAVPQLDAVEANLRQTLATAPNPVRALETFRQNVRAGTLSEPEKTGRLALADKLEGEGLVGKGPAMQPEGEPPAPEQQVEPARDYREPWEMGQDYYRDHHHEFPTTAENAFGYKTRYQPYATGAQAQRMNENILIRHRLAVEEAAKQGKIGAGILNYPDLAAEYGKPGPGAKAATPQPDIWYHGTGTKGLTAETLTPDFGRDTSLFGAGIYVTDNPTVAEGYAKARSKRTGTPTVYSLRLKSGAVMDLKERPHPDLVDALMLAAGDNPDLQAGATAAGQARTGDDAMRGFLNAVAEDSHDNMTPASEYVEPFQEFRQSLREKGWTALEYEGGKRVGKQPHRALVIIDPTVIESLQAVSPRPTEAAVTPAAKAAPTRLVAPKLGIAEQPAPVTVLSRHITARGNVVAMLPDGRGIVISPQPNIHAVDVRIAAYEGANSYIVGSRRFLTKAEALAFVNTLDPRKLDWGYKPVTASNRVPPAGFRPFTEFVMRPPPEGTPREPPAGNPPEVGLVTRKLQRMKGRATRKLLAVRNISDFEVGRDRVVREGNRTFVVDTQGQRARLEVQSDVMPPEWETRYREQTPIQRQFAHQSVESTPQLSAEGKQERLDVMDRVDAEHGLAPAKAAGAAPPEVAAAKEYLKGEKGLRKAYGGGPSAEEMRSYLIVGRALARQGGKDFKTWARMMGEELGTGHESKLPAVWAAMGHEKPSDRQMQAMGLMPRPGLAPLQLAIGNIRAGKATPADWKTTGDYMVGQGTTDYGAFVLGMTRMLGKNVRPKLPGAWRSVDAVVQETGRIGKTAFRLPGLPTTQAKTALGRAIKQVGRVFLEPEEQPALAPEVHQLVGGLSGLVRQTQKLAAGARAKLETAYTTERGRRAGRLGGIRESAQGEAWLNRSLGAMKGELVEEAAIPTYESLRGKISQAQIDTLIDQTRTSPALTSPWDRVRAGAAIRKLIDGHIPQKNELELLEAVFGPRLVKAALSRVSEGSRIGRAILDVGNFLRANLASGDVSAPGRQGIVMVGNKAWWTSWLPQFQAMGSNARARAIDAAMRADPLYKVAHDMGVFRGEPTPRAAVGLEPAKAYEEMYLSAAAQRLRHVAMSNRAYTTFLNLLRFETFKKYYNWTGGLESDGAYKRLAAGINQRSGRGTGAWLDRNGSLLANVFFSPRFQVSRLQSFAALADPKASSLARKVAAHDLVTFLGAGMSALAVAKVTGAKVSTDSRSPDFLKIRVGKTTYDPWGGFQQIARVMGQLWFAQRVSPTTGRVQEKVRRPEIIGRFLLQKLAPLPSTGVAIYRGTTVVGEKVEFNPEAIGNLLYRNMTPMAIQDLADALAEEGLGAGLAAGGASAAGIGVQTYEKRPPKAGGSISGNLRGTLRGSTLRSGL